MSNRIVNGTNVPNFVLDGLPVVLFIDASKVLAWTKLPIQGMALALEIKSIKGQMLLNRVTCHSLNLLSY